MIITTVTSGILIRVERNASAKATHTHTPGIAHEVNVFGELGDVWGVGHEVNACEGFARRSGCEVNAFIYEGVVARA